MRKHGRIGKWSIFAALILAAGAPACGGDDPSEVVSYLDSADRSCTVDLSDISATATCDVDPEPLVSCEPGQEAAFVVGGDHDFDTMISTLENCAACIDREARMTYTASMTCANVTCEADMDCVYSGYSCTGGICTMR